VVLSSHIVSWPKDDLSLGSKLNMTLSSPPIIYKRYLPVRLTKQDFALDMIQSKIYRTYRTVTAP